MHFLDEFHCLPVFRVSRFQPSVPLGGKEWARQEVATGHRRGRQWPIKNGLEGHSQTFILERGRGESPGAGSRDGPAQDLGLLCERGWCEHKVKTGSRTVRRMGCEEIRGSSEGKRWGRRGEAGGRARGAHLPVTGPLAQPAGEASHGEDELEENENGECPRQDHPVAVLRPGHREQRFWAGEQDGNRFQIWHCKVPQREARPCIP